MLPRTSKTVAALTSALILLMLSSQIATAIRSIRDIPPTKHLAPTGTALSDIAAAIKLTAAEEGWVALQIDPDLIRATLRVRTHKAVVTIGFDDTNFWITYADSINMGYQPDKHVQHAGDWIEGPVIHGNYNVWVELLAQSIAASVKNPPKSNSSVVVPCDSVLLIADELERLDALRARGVLTQEEFDQQKAKLLAR